MNKFKTITGVFVLMMAQLLLSSSRRDNPSACFKQLQTLDNGGDWITYPNNPVLKPGPKGAWDAGALGSMTVLKAGNLFHMYYEAWGVRSEKLQDYNSLQIGHATSKDGLHWTKDPANPVLPKGDAGDWDADGAWDPFVLYEDGQFKMWYGGGMDQHCDWGYAVSTDGIHFEKKGQISRLGNVEDDHIVHDKATGLYFMYYWNRKFEPSGLFRAESPDETHFDFTHAARITIKGPDPQTMYKFTHVIKNDGRWEMFFGKFVRPACKGSSTGFATSQDGLHWTAGRTDLLTGIDGEILRIADNEWIMYYGKDGFFDGAGQDIRAAIYQGKLAGLAGK